MGVLSSEFGYTLATTGRGDHEVHKEHVVALGKKTCIVRKKKSGFGGLAVSMLASGT
jgi:hypothetical protein